MTGRRLSRQKARKSSIFQGVAEKADDRFSDGDSLPDALGFEAGFETGGDFPHQQRHSFPSLGSAVTLLFQLRF